MGFRMSLHQTRTPLNELDSAKKQPKRKSRGAKSKNGKLLPPGFGEEWATTDFKYVQFVVTSFKNLV